MIKAGALAILVYTIAGTGSSVQLQQFSDDIWFYSAFKQSNISVSILLVAPWSVKVCVSFRLITEITVRTKTGCAAWTVAGAPSRAGLPSTSWRFPTQYLQQ